MIVENKSNACQALKLFLASLRACVCARVCVHVFVCVHGLTDPEQQWLKFCSLSDIEKFSTQKIRRLVWRIA